MSPQSELTLNITGMHCASCVRSIEEAVNSLEGVVDCRVNLALQSGAVSFAEGRITPQAIIDKIRQLGYEAEVGSRDILTANRKEVFATRRTFIHSAILTFPLVVVAMWPMFVGQPLFGKTIDGLIEAATAATVLFYSGRGIILDALRQTARFRANMNSLIAMGTLTAFGWSIYAFIGQEESLYFDSAGMIITLILLGRYLEARSKGRAGEAIAALLRLRPGKTTALINEVPIEIDPAEAMPDMVLLVKPGERVPADGLIIDGAPVIDESMLTGESVPVEKRPGDQVVGGSLNGNKSFHMKVTVIGENSFLARIIRLVSEAQGRKAPIQSLADRVAGVFVPIVIGIAIITWGAWYLFDPTNPLLVRSVISVLIIACPCALGLATPTAVLAGTGRAAREGIIIRGGDILERLSKVNAMLFDKTGTLTHGQLEVVDVKTFENISPRQFLRIVGSVESQSEHPVAQAIVRYTRRHQIENISAGNVEARPGFGVTADCGGQKVIVGTRSLMEEQQAELGQTLDASELEMAKGRTVVFGAVDGHAVGIICLSDKLREDAREVINKLKPSLARLEMISGDNSRTAAGIARAIGLDSFQAEVKPHQKKLIVDSFRKAGYRIAMVGDGINDAPALAAADVGVAVGTGTDIAVETADVVLIRPELSGLLKMFTVSRMTMKIIKQNLFWALFYNVIAIPVAAGLLYPLWGLTLSPVMAAAAMALSSVFVVSNSLRLNRLELL